MRIMAYQSINIYEKEKDKTIKIETIETGDVVYTREDANYIESTLVGVEVGNTYNESHIYTNYYAIIHKYGGYTEKVLLNDLYIRIDTDNFSYYEKIINADIKYNPVILDDYGNIIFIKDTCKVGVISPSRIDNMYWIDGIIKDIDTDSRKIIISINSNETIEIYPDTSYGYLIRKCDI